MVFNLHQNKIFFEGQNISTNNSVLARYSTEPGTSTLRGSHREQYHQPTVNSNSLHKLH